ncbi:MAG: DUF4418 family protein [Synergistaceae bacterium]|nr:DUF4418 family protein [Synergistaceae bacterium]
MKNRIISGVSALILGLLISMGPRYLFKVCEPAPGSRFMNCHWTARAELGVGVMIAVLGLTLLVFKSGGTRLGVACAIFLSGALVLSFPHALIGGCAMEAMACRRTAFPALTVLGVLTVVGSALEIFYLYRGRIV